MSDDPSANDALGTLRAAIKQAVTDVHEQTPLAQSFTNFVTINLVANAQLAAGGTAAMSYLPDDVIATAEIAGSNYINVGTLLPFFKDAFVSVSYTAHLLFVVLFLFTMDGVAKLSFFLALSFTGLTAFFQIIGASFAGILALYGLGAVLRSVPDHWLLSPLLLVGAALAIRYFTIQTWRPFTRAAGRAYLRRVGAPDQPRPFQVVMPEVAPSMFATV